MDALSNEESQNNKELNFVLGGQKMNLLDHSSRREWQMLPPKAHVYPEQVQQILFRQYQGVGWQEHLSTTAAAMELESDDEEAHDTVVLDADVDPEFAAVRQLLVRLFYSVSMLLSNIKHEI